MRESSQFNNMTNKQKIIWGIAYYVTITAL